jgi:two-component system NtrC family sensor kinase
MAIAPKPYQDELRIEKLKSYLILDTEAEEQFDKLTALASSICNTPIALISLLDNSRQWFKSSIGLETCETPRDISFCQFAIHHDTFFEVPDTTLDPRFAENPLVTGEPHIQFYGGQPLITPDNFRIGTLCVIDTKPRNLTSEQKNAINTLAQEVVMHLELRIKSTQLKQASDTELRRTKDLLIQSGKLASLGQMIATIAHEIQNPLWVVDMAVQNQKQQTQELSQQLEHLNAAAKTPSKLTTTIEHFLNASTKNQSLMETAVASLNEVTQALKTQSHRDLHPSYDVSIKQVLAEALIITQGKLIGCDVVNNTAKLPPCCCFRSQLGQVFINILSNAADAIAEQKQKNSLQGIDYHGEIHIKADTADHEGEKGITISFSDNGTGIPVNARPHVFTEFFTTKSAGKGTGLGLSLSHSIIKTHRGTIDILDSELHGVKFSIWIPLDIEQGQFLSARKGA